MKKGALSELFTGIAAKFLSAVEASPERSNQHEYNGVAPLRDLFGLDRLTLEADFIYLADEEEDIITDTGNITWYDARESHPTRTEYRLYFPTNSVTDEAAESDLLAIARRPDGKPLVLVAKAKSTAENQILYLFNLPSPGADFIGKEVEDSQIGFVEKVILDHLGVEIEEREDRFLDLMLEKFGNVFPTTRIFSAFARETFGEASPHAAPDQTLVAWLDHEERLFRTLERHIVTEQLEEGFHGDVDRFISFSLSVHNRRKSRAGHSLENHLSQIFAENDLIFERGVITENRSKPDFLFPGYTPYHDPGFPETRLTMLGVKTTCKDRWRQVLTEANRISSKHLLTLEPGISEHQTNEMQSQSLNLVLPAPIHTSFTETQRSWLLNVADFIEMVKEKQSF
jgi:hypothetical protein